MLKIIVQNYCSIKVSHIMALENGEVLFDSLKRKFTYNNPDYIEAKKWGRSLYKLEPHIFTYRVLGDEIQIYRGGLNKITKFFDINHIEYQIVDYTLVLPQTTFFKKAKYNLRQDQIDFKNALLVNPNPTVGFIQGIGLGNPSFGKTFTSINLIQELGQPALILVHTKFLQQQWIKAMIEDFGMSKEDIGGAGGVFAGKPKVRKINVALYHSMSKREINVHFKDHIGILIVDECLHEDTLIRVPSGIKKLKNINIGDDVITPNGLTVKVKNKWSVEKEAIEVTTKGGCSLIGSKDHLVPTLTYNTKKFYKRLSKKEIKKLSECSNLILNEAIIKKPINKEEEFIGWFLGDGTIDKGHIKFAFRKEEKIYVFEKLLNDIGYEFNKFVNSRGDTIFGLKYQDKFNSYFFNLKTKEKEIPEYLFNSLSIGVLKGLFDSDGTFTNTYVEFTNTSHGLVKQIQIMLRMSGIKADYYEIKRNNIKHSTAYRLIISGKSIERFNDLIGFSVESKNKKLLKHIPKIKSDNEHEWITSVKELGIKKLIDIELDNEEKLFVANGFISHNCQKASIKQFIDSINPFRARYRYGVSASIDRKDGKKFIILDLMGEVKFIAKVDETVESNSQISCRIFGTRTGVRPTEEFNSSILSELADVEERNIRIARSAVREVRQGKIVIIFVERKKQAGILAKLLSKFRTYLLIGAVNPKELKKLDIPDKAKKILEDNEPELAFDEVNELALKKELDIIIATQKGEVGLSIETLNHGIVTTPVGNNIERFNQLKGRIERKHKDKRLELFGEKPIPTLEVMVDDWDSSYNAWTLIKENYKDLIIKNPYLIKKG